MEANDIIQNAQTIAFNKRNSISLIQLNSSASIKETDAKQWLLRTVFKTENGYDLIAYRSETDRLGFTHTRFKEYYKGFEVEHGVYIVHSKNGFVTTVNGNFYSDIRLIESKSNIGYVSAETSAKKAFSSPNNVRNENNTDTKLRIISKNNQYYFCYKFHLSSLSPLQKLDIYINAHNGEKLLEISKIHTGDVAGTATTAYTGVRSITCNQVNTNAYTLTENTRNIATKNCNQSTGYTTAVNFTNTSPNWTGSTITEKAPLDAHLGAEQTYDYYLQKFGRNSYDDHGSQIISYVHYGSLFDNAFWDGSSMSFGDGNGVSMSALTTTDIVGHEFTHAVTQYTANLDYLDESGALNESFSDIFGVSIDFFGNPITANFKIGEQVNSGYRPFRDMVNPNNTYQPDTYMGLYWVPAGGGDYGGVHFNSQVQNHWYYLLCMGGTGTNDNGDTYAVTGIGIEKAAQIAYRTLTYYLVSNSQFSDARTYSIQSAIDLYGICSNEVRQCINAWYAVGVGTLTNPYTTNAIFYADKLVMCALPATIHFTNLSANATSYLWDFGDGVGTSTVANPSYTYTTSGTFNVRLIAEGTNICNIDTLTKTAYLNISNTGAPVSTCSPIQGSKDSAYGILKVSLDGIQHNSGKANEGNKDFTCTQQTYLVAGERYIINVNTDTIEDVKVWIDYNNNGAFNDSTELILNTKNRNKHSAQFVTDIAAVLNTPLRMRVYDDDVSYTVVSACTPHHYGQTEDYTIRFVANTLPPIAKFKASSLTIPVGTFVAFTDTSLRVPTQWEWLFPGATTTSSTLQNPTVQYNTIGLFPVTLIAKNAFGSDTLLQTAYINVLPAVNMCTASIDTSTIDEGLLFDSGGILGDYGNSQNCSYLLSVPCASSITLTIDSLNIETDYDNLYIYDGNSASSPLLGTYTGELHTRPILHSTSNHLFFQFTSDVSTTLSGYQLQWKAVKYGTTKPKADFSISNANPPLRSTVLFTDLTTNSPEHWNWDFGDGTTSTLQNPSHVFNSPGVKNVQLIVRNCTQADTIIKIIIVTEEPRMVLSPDTIYVTVNCGDTLIVPFTISNIGSGLLQYNVDQIPADDSVNILACTWGVDTLSGSAFKNTILAIGQYYSKFRITTFNDTTIAKFQLAMLNKDIVLFPRQETKSFDHYSAFSIPLQQFATSGGLVIFCGEDYTSPNRLFETKLFTGTPGAIATYSKINIINNTDAITQGCAYSFFGPNAAFSANITNADKIQLFAHITEDVVTYRNIGAGKAIYIASSFALMDTNFSKMISNAVRLKNKNFVPSSFNVYPAHDTIPAGESRNVGILLNTNGRNAGYFSAQIQVNSNDTSHSNSAVILNYQILGMPSISTSKTCIIFDSLFTQQHKADSFSISNTGCDTLHIDSITTSQSIFTVSPSLVTLLPDQSTQVALSCFSASAGNYADTLIIHSNIGISKVCISAPITDAPQHSVSRDTLRVSLKACGKTQTEKLVVSNSGGSPLQLKVNGDAWNSTNILIFAAQADTTGSYYINVKLALSQYLSNYTLTKFTGTTTAQFKSALAGKDVLLIPSQRYYYKNGFTVYRSLIQDFVNAGGTLIFCNNQASLSYSALDDLGIFNTSVMNVNNPGSVNIVNTLHPITNNLSANPFIVNDNVTYINLSGTNVTKLCKMGGNDVVTMSEIGNGRAFFIGYNFNYSIPDFNKLLCNTIRFSKKIPTWISVAHYNNSVQAGTNDSLLLTFSSANLTVGTYYYPLVISTNDPLRSLDSVICILTVDNTPCGRFSDSLQSPCGGTVSFFDSTFNNPTAWFWDFGDSTFSNYKHPVHSYVLPGVYPVTLRVCNGSICDTVVKNITISATTAPVGAFCYPNTQHPSSAFGILNVTLNQINNTTAAGTDGYKDYTCLSTTDLYFGASYQLSITTAPNELHYVSAAIDYDNDGVFSTNENLFFNKSNLGVLHFSYTVPATVTLNRSQRLRIIADQNSPTNFCYQPFSGQVEDYSVRFVLNVQPPIASFTSYNVNTCDGIMSFEDNSTNNPTAWQWDFGDSTTSNIQNPTHKYAVAGTYTVKLTASNTYGSHTNSFNVSVNPVVLTMSVNGSMAAQQPIQFSSNIPNAITYSWLFGDGAESGFDNPTHTYTSGGTYIVRLYCLVNGCQVTVNDTLIINPVGIHTLYNNTAITVSPNPFSEFTQLHVSLIDNAPLQVDVYSVTGQKISGIYNNAKCQKGEYTFTITDLPSGTYFVLIQIGEKRYFKKIVAIQH